MNNDIYNVGGFSSCNEVMFADEVSAGIALNNNAIYSKEDVYSLHTFEGKVDFAGMQEYKSGRVGGFMPDLSSITIFLIFIGFILSAVIKAVCRKSLFAPFITIFIPKFKSKQDDEEVIYKFYNTLFSMLFFIGILLLFIQIIKTHNLKLFALDAYSIGIILALLATGAYFAIKIINKILDIVFNLTIFSKYNDISTAIVNGLGFPLFLLNSASVLATPKMQSFFTLTSIILLIIITLTRFVKYAQINYLSKLRFYYLFLYICTLEIVPILIVFKVISLV